MKIVTRAYCMLQATRIRLWKSDLRFKGSPWYTWHWFFLWLWTCLSSPFGKAWSFFLKNILIALDKVLKRLYFTLWSFKKWNILSDHFMLGTIPNSSSLFHLLLTSSGSRYFSFQFGAVKWRHKKFPKLPMSALVMWWEAAFNLVWI